MSGRLTWFAGWASIRVVAERNIRIRAVRMLPPPGATISLEAMVIDRAPTHWKDHFGG